MAIDAKIEPYKKFVSMIKSHWSGVAAYFDKRVTNGVLEGINSKIQLAKRRAKGYRDVNNYINMIYFLTAKLKFDYTLFVIEPRILYHFSLLE
jgi:transposase